MSTTRVPICAYGAVFAILALAFAAASSADDKVFRLENGRLLVEFSAADGSLTRIRNKPAALELISVADEPKRPWAMLLGPAELVVAFDSFHADVSAVESLQKLRFEWQTQHEIVVRAEAALVDDALRLVCSAENRGDRTILALRYPDIRGIGPLAEEGGRQRLLHSAATGLIFHDPLRLFRHDSPIPLERGLTAARYPNGFHGSALQLMAYYVEGQGGFSIATEDGRSGDKDFNFFKCSPDSLACEVAHFNWDARPGKSLEIDYPTVIAGLTEGSWYEAAERYRGWALQQAWCRRGPLRERVAQGDASRWLLEEIGSVGMWWPFRDDLRSQIARTRERLGAPLLHLELWWRHQPSVVAAQSQGDRFGPFYFPFLAQRGRGPLQSHSADPVAPPAFSITPDWVAMCSAQLGWRSVFLESAEDLAARESLRHHQIWIDENRSGCDADCLYYDIGPCAGVPTHCYAADHDHLPGAGRQITDAHVSLIRESQLRASRVKRQYVPTGTECVAEPFIGCLDLYYQRNSGFNLEMELAPYVRQLTWLPDGEMEAVPLLPFVYHAYGPVATQGVYSIDPWSNSQGDDYHAWAEARAFLWGGTLTVFPLGERVSETDAHVAFLRELIAARTGYARDFLVYGTMQRPPSVVCETLALDHGLAAGGWLRKLRFEDAALAARSVGVKVDSPDVAGVEPAQKSAADLSVEKWVAEMLAIGATPAKRPTIAVQAVQCQAYTSDDARLGVLLAELRRNDCKPIRVVIDPTLAGLPTGAYEAWRESSAGRTRLATFRDRSEISLELAPRSVVLIETRRVGD